MTSYNTCIWCGFSRCRCSLPQCSPVSTGIPMSLSTSTDSHATMDLPSPSGTEQYQLAYVNPNETLLSPYQPAPQQFYRYPQTSSVANRGNINTAWTASRGHGVVAQPDVTPYAASARRPSASDSVGSQNAKSEHRYVCLHAGCTSNFGRATDLKRHVKSRHDIENNLMDCPHRWCGRVGQYGFTRKDHRNEHLREVHKDHIPKASTRRGSRGSR